LELIDFYITSITPPEDVQKMIDARGGMAAVGDLNRFLKFGLAKAFAESGSAWPAAGAGMGMGAGVGVGLLVPGLLSKAMAPNPTDLKSDPLPTITCSKCGNDTPEESRFCYRCGNHMVAINRCPACGVDLPAEAVFCLVCGTKLTDKIACTHCNASLPQGSKFCPQCGNVAGDPPSGGPGEPTSGKSGSGPAK
jgi:membrane protease subunit (stomatin/prohibitin family)